LNAWAESNCPLEPFALFTYTNLDIYRTTKTEQHDYNLLEQGRHNHRNNRQNMASVCLNLNFHDKIQTRIRAVLQLLLTLHKAD
jgi:hypothetical protein